MVFTMARQSLKRLCIGLIVFAFLSRIFIYSVSDNYLLLFTSLVAEADALAFGSLLAIVIREDVSRKLIIRHFGMWGGGLGVLGMAVCTISTGLAAYWVPATWTLNPLNLALLSFMACFFGGLLMIAVLADNSSIARILNNPFLSHIGKISYGIYLYHYVVFFFVDALFNKIRIAFGISSPLLLSIVIKILVTYLVALLSYYLVELRFLQLKNRFSYAPIQNSGVVCIDFAYSRQQKTVQ
jgi:peptidoglycan/LPS O-acetylase OafA/YrhL